MAVMIAETRNAAAPVASPFTYAHRMSSADLVTIAVCPISPSPSSPASDANMIATPTLGVILFQACISIFSSITLFKPTFSPGLWGDERRLTFFLRLATTKTTPRNESKTECECHDTMVCYSLWIDRNPIWSVLGTGVTISRLSKQYGIKWEILGWVVGEGKWKWKSRRRFRNSRHSWRNLNPSRKFPLPNPAAPSPRLSGSVILLSESVCVCR